MTHLIFSVRHPCPAHVNFLNLLALFQGFAAGSALQCLPRQHFAAPATRRNVGRSSLRAVAEGQDEDGPKLTFGSNRNAARGYTEEDSAGQSNIFAVEVTLGCHCSARFN